MNRRHFVKGLGGAGVYALGHPARAAVAPPETTRQRWAATLERLARPVLEALAADQLRQRMPVESQPSVRADRAKYTHLEAFGRLLAGMGPWLNLSSEAESVLRQRYFSLVAKGLQNAVNPQARDFMNFSQGGQPLVDAAFLAYGIIRCPKLWEQADATTRQNLMQALLATRAIRPGFNNWLLFSGMIEAFFVRFDQPYDKMRLDYALRQHDQWYKGDGVYGDGPDFHWDYYNSYVIQPFLTEILSVVVPKEPTYKVLQERVGKIAARYAEIQERLIAPDGTFPVIGRSIVYRAGAFHHLANTAYRHELPASLRPAQVREGLTAVLDRTLSAAANFDANGWLTIGLSGHQPALGETYISTGSLYGCALALLPLGLPPTDAFWADPAEDWTSRKVWQGQNLPADHALRL